ncbi:MAG: hypothetical protein DPW18_13540 [Chloroflexi bacterium]|nr:hypothetical protein [Chloroflexota bacterium]MDL1943407.1 hypothetical protein [Chloroflexi bacterium CFX2]
MKKFLYLILALTLAACSAVPQSEFDENIAKWRDASISHYRYQLFIGCFCPFAEDMPLTIEVKDGEVVSMTRFDGTPIDPADPAYETYRLYSTMDRLFLELEAELNGEADEVLVTYDPLFGFPVSIAIDRIKEAVDDELSLQVSNFEMLE